MERREAARVVLPLLPAVAAALIVAALGARFAMRLVGVRDDIPFPGAIYSLTQPLVAPFSALNRGDMRFDHTAVEPAALAAAGAVIAAVLLLYVLWLVAWPANRALPQE